MWSGALMTAVSGLALKLGDDVLDEGLGPESLAVVLSCAAVAASVCAVGMGVPPSFPVGLSIGNAVAGKLDEPVHVVAAVVVCIGSVAVGGIPDPVSTSLVASLAALDEVMHDKGLDLGVRPALKVGLPVAWVVGVVPLELPVAAWCFDAGYHLGGWIVVRASNRAGGGAGRGSSEGCGTCE
ncbi:MAG: hypothetical protein GXO28_02120 [Methanopyri archaeon]|nr:hypothetical protein [Methanopyri archaeon]